MEIIRRKILREEFTSRKPDASYGQIVDDFIYINVFLNQDIDNMGVFTDEEFIPTTPVAPDKEKIYNDYRPNFEKKSWFKKGSKLTVQTDSKLINLKGYKENARYKEGFDSKKESYVNINNVEIDGVSRITKLEDDEITYVFDAPNNGFIGTSNQTEGLLYKDIDGEGTTVTYQTQGLNETNSSLSAITKEEYLMGIINKPEIHNDVFIDRGEVSPLEPHLRLSEVDTLEHLMRYGNGYFKVVK
jgi:hypothetical protein